MCIRDRTTRDSEQTQECLTFFGAHRNPPTPAQAVDFMDDTLRSKKASGALIQVVTGDFDLCSATGMKEVRACLHKIQKVVRTKCEAAHRHPHKKRCSVTFVTTPPPVHKFVPPSTSCGNDFTMPHFRDSSKVANLKWVERVAMNIVKVHEACKKFAAAPGLTHEVKYADISQYLPLHGKSVLEPYKTTLPWPRAQRTLSLDALSYNTKNRICNSICGEVFKYRSTKMPARR